MELTWKTGSVATYVQSEEDLKGVWEMWRQGRKKILLIQKKLTEQRLRARHLGFVLSARETDMSKTPSLTTRSSQALGQDRLKQKTAISCDKIEREEGSLL